MTNNGGPIVALIPARGGSKGIPGKNLATLGGLPLIAHTIAAARAARSIDRVFVSTDDERIAEVCRGLGVEVPWMRPPELARDDVPMIAVIVHLLERLAEEGIRPEAVALLQPTSPLRRAEHIDEAVERFRNEGADTLVSVVEVPHQFTPDSLMELAEDGSLRPLHGTRPATRRQDKPTLYARNGPAILILRPDVVEEDALYGDRTTPYVMDAADSVDIDAPHDLALAEWLLSQRGAGSAAEEGDR